MFKKIFEKIAPRTSQKNSMISLWFQLDSMLILQNASQTNKKIGTHKSKKAKIC